MHIVSHVTALVASLWLVMFALLVYDNPTCHPFVSHNERQYLTDVLKHDMAFNKVTPHASHYLY